MNFTEHKITLDIHKTVSQVAISVKKGDTGRRLAIELTQKGYPYHLSNDCYAVFTAKKPDGHVVFNNCYIKGCTILYDVTEQTVAAVGIAECEIILYGRDGKQLTSASFQMIIEDTVYDTEAEVESSDEFNALRDLITKVLRVHGDGAAAPAILAEVEGTVINLSDASNFPVQGLRIFGKSTQAAVPTLDNPVEIVDLAAPVITVTDGTEENAQTMAITTAVSLAGIPVASGGNYTDANGQQWICDEVDLARGVYVQRVKKKRISSTAGWLYSTSTLRFYAFDYDFEKKSAYIVANVLCTHFKAKQSSTFNDLEISYTGETIEGYAFKYDALNGDISAWKKYLQENEVYVLGVLAAPIETKLTADEIAAFATLHTNKLITTIYTDVSAHMAAEYVVDTKTYIDRHSGSDGGSAGSAVTIGAVTLLAAAWKGDAAPYSQVVAIAGVTEYSQVDLNPSVEQLTIFHNKDLAFVTENDGGTVTVYAIGDKPQNDYTIQVTITEVNV